MYQSYISSDARNWFLWFILKIGIFTIGLLFIYYGLIGASIIIIGIGMLIGFISSVFIYRDVVKDPYQILRLIQIQILIWWRLSGPVIKQKPFIIHFPEGYSLQDKNVNYTIALKMTDIKSRKSIVINVKTPQICPECNGKRNKPMTVHIECPHCQNGKQLYKYQSLTVPIPCNKCLGIGWVPVQSCDLCKGKGSIWKKQNIRIQIPENVFSGTKLRIPALGKVDPENLTQGDLYLKIRKKFIGIL